LACGRPARGEFPGVLAGPGRAGKRSIGMWGPRGSGVMPNPGEPDGPPTDGGRCDLPGPKGPAGLGAPAGHACHLQASPEPGNPPAPPRPSRSGWKGFGDASAGQLGLPSCPNSCPNLRLPPQVRTRVRTKGQTMIRKKAKVARAAVCDSGKAAGRSVFLHPKPVGRRCPNSCPNLSTSYCLPARWLYGCKNISCVNRTRPHGGLL